VCREKRSIFFEFYSHRKSVFETIDNSSSFFSKFISESEAIGLKVILRELLMNAVVHGNKSKGELLVKCAIEHLGDKAFKISVEDEGGGFDYGSVADDDQDFQHHRKGRGYLLINRLCDRIHFNEKGNRITVHLRGNL
jgi:anti-sigma regulatory factor (Ser/Thr protein kinase)